MKLVGIVGMVGALAAALAAQQSTQSAPQTALPLRILVVESPAKAQHLHEKLASGEDFAVLAKENSTDPTAESGGYMGLTDPATLRPELRDSLAGVKPGGISAVAHISSGYAILQILPPESIAQMDRANRDRAAAVSALGAIKYTPNVSGIGEAESALFRSPKPAGWAQDLRQICESRKQTLANATQKMEALLDPANADKLAALPPVDVTQEYYALGELYAYPGEMDKAIAQYKKALDVAAAKAPAVLPQIEEELAVAYLHKSEMDNSIYHGQGDHCVFPLPAEAAFTKKNLRARPSSTFANFSRLCPTT